MLISNEIETAQLFDLKKWSLTARQQCDLECLQNGAYFPLTGFLDELDYHSVCETMRLDNGTLWPIPITLDVSEEFAKQLKLGESIVLINDENTPLALLTVSSCWQPNKEKEARMVFGTTDRKHPSVHYLNAIAGSWYVGGALRQLETVKHYDFVKYRHTPAELKAEFLKRGWEKIIAFQTRNPMHRAHHELTLRAAMDHNAHLLIHPVTGMTKPGDVDYVTRVKCYEQMLLKYPNNQVMLSLLPLAMRMAGPREALWHGLIRKNYGVTHFIVGRDHAGPGLNSQNKPIYEPYAAQTMLLKYANEIGIEAVPFPAMVYVKNKAQFLSMEEVEAADMVEDVSGTELRSLLANGEQIPDWFTFPEIAKTLHESYPPRREHGFTVFFTGLSGAGKTTLAKALYAKLMEMGTRTVTLLDGDVLRKHLSQELGFSKQDRDTHIQRVGFVASEITKHRGIAISAAIAPYAESRQWVREMVSQFGGFIEVYIATPIAVCRQRDIKGLYKKAELGLLQGFTGVNDPYEVPTHPEVTIDTSDTGIAEGVERILSTLRSLRFLI